MMIKMLSVTRSAAALFIGLCLLQGCAGTTAIDRSSIHVINGDAIQVGDEQVQIVGMDAPATQNAVCDLERNLGEKSKEALYHLLSYGKIEMKRAGGMDQLGRTLAYIFIDGKDVAQTMISQGYAREDHGGKRLSWCH